VATRTDDPITLPLVSKHCQVEDQRRSGPLSCLQP